MKWRVFIILVLIFGLVFVIYAYRNSINLKTTSFTILNLSDNYPSNFVSIRDLNQNPSSYVGKNITTNGMMTYESDGYRLEDNSGYWVWIGTDVLGSGCINNQQDYNYDSQIYTAHGVLLTPESRSGIGIQYQYRLSCSTLLS
jgi:hypothetical protein